jgi:small-conductance mechanosensitive channel
MPIRDLLARIRQAMLPALFVLAASTGWAQAPVPAAAASADAPAAQPDEAREARATRIQLANRTIAVLRVPFLGVSPENRAVRAEAALRELLRAGGPGVVTVQVEPQGHAILVDGALVTVLTAGDADRLRGQSLAQASRAARVQLEQAYAEAREAQDPGRLLRAAGLSVLATVGALAVLVLVWRARRAAVGWLARVVTRHTERLRVAGAQLLATDRMAAMARALLGVVAWSLIALLLFEWLRYVLAQFPYTRPWAEGLSAFLTGIARQLGGSALLAVPDLIVALVIFAAARGVVLLFKPFFDRVASTGRQDNGWLDADTARPTQRLFSLIVAVFAVVMAYPYLPGSSSDAFKGISVLLGLMVTIGGSNLFGQAASGLVLMYSRTLRVGEYVRIADHEGTVTEMGSFTTRLRTGLGEELTLPNALVLGTVTKNYSRAVKGHGFIVDTTVTIGYDTPWRQVEAMLIEAAQLTPGVLAQPVPRVFQTALSDFYPEYRLVCQAVPSDPAPRAQVLSALHANIQDVFNRYGVQIMSPHYLADPAAAKVVPPEGWYAEPARREPN